MCIGWVARRHAGPPWTTLCSLASTLSPDPPSVRTWSPGRLSRLSTMPWPMAWSKLVGYGSSSRSSMSRCRRALSSTMTTSVPSTSPPIPFNISAPRMSRSTSTSSKNTLPSAMLASYTSRRPPSLRTSSQMVCLLQCFWKFGPISTFVVARVSTMGC
jgi:hypothetical protein